MFVRNTRARDIRTMPSKFRRDSLNEGQREEINYYR